MLGLYAPTVYTEIMDAENTEQRKGVPNSSEPFGNVQKPSEGFGSLPNLSERKANHTLTVRQAARMFEDAGVPRSDHTITNWCHADKETGASKLDCYRDPNDRKFFITPESLRTAIAEEKDKVGVENLPNSSKPFGNIPKASEIILQSFPKSSEAPPKQERPQAVGEGRSDTEISEDAESLRVLKAKIRRMNIEAEVNKRYIEKLEQERAKDVDRMIEQGRTIGTLENQVKQLEAPKPQSRQTSETYPPHVREAEIVPDHSFSQTKQRPTSEEVSLH